MIQDADETMQHQVDEMKSPRVQPAHVVIRPEGQHCDGPVRLVTLLSRHGRAPEVVVEHIHQRRAPSRVIIVSHRGDIVEDESAAETVPVADAAGQNQEESRRGPVYLRWRRRLVHRPHQGAPAPHFKAKCFVGGEAFISEAFSPFEFERTFLQSLNC